MLELRGLASRVKMIISDFDGVFTDNKVYIDSNGNESVSCSRSDSLGLSYYKTQLLSGNIDFGFLVVSTETNSVVGARCSKLNLDFQTGIVDKANFLKNRYASSLNSSGVLEGFLYLGNDLNDLDAIRLCEFSAAPSDAHDTILRSVGYVSLFAGGNGFIRDVITKILP